MENEEIVEEVEQKEVNKPRKHKISSKQIINYITQTAIFGGLAAILYCVPVFQFNLPFVAPGFMKIHLDDIPILLSSLASGPIIGVFELLLKTIIKLPMTSTMGIGELGDLMYSLALILPASIIYKFNRTIKGAIIGIGTGLLSTLFFSSVVNLYTIFPFYKWLWGLDDGYIANSFDTIFHWGITNDSDIRLAILLLPFNAIKNAIVIAVTFVAYKPLRFLLEKVYK